MYGTVSILNYALILYSTVGKQGERGKAKLSTRQIRLETR
jgi:hypothetical protein